LPCPLDGPEALSLPYQAQLNTLGYRIRKHRLDLGLLQQEVAAAIGVTESTIWNWEANGSSPQLRFILKIIAFLG
jgi:transcriptional regulator with XRE-family HTH domain